MPIILDTLQSYLRKSSVIGYYIFILNYLILHVIITKSSFFNLKNQVLKPKMGFG